MLNDETPLSLFQDHLLDDSVRGAIHDFALDAREILTNEARELLQGTYGLHDDGTLEAPRRLPALADPETRITYDRLKKFLDDEIAAGLPAAEAVAKLVKEIAFTHTNRLVAFKMMETRKLIKEAVGRRHESNGFKIYLAEHADDYALYQRGEADAPYQRFLLWQAGQIAQQVNVLFDPDDLPSRFFPRPVALRDVLNLLNAPELVPAWAADETIGWVYQFFSEQEKAEVFERLFGQKQKIRRADIPAATQLFTPRWIVRFLVENTLGRLWLTLHPDSRLQAAMRYLVPRANENSADDAASNNTSRLVRDVTLLDPACGTMHFGLVAFDLFYEMYREELERAGEPGWASEPSVASVQEIPAAILKHNLFGIDIDLRAVQLSALTLFLKAKSRNKNAVINDHNLACADVLPLDGERLNAFLQTSSLNRPLFKRLIKALWDALEDMNQLGSLIRLETTVGELIAQERKEFERESRRLDLFGERAERFEADAMRPEYWETLSDRLVSEVQAFAKSQAAHGRDERFFAHEAEEGLRILNLMLRRYDCVVTNPPYMSRGSMNNTIADFLTDAYPKGKGDLYAAFIQRCAELTRDQGYVGMITQQSFMFISSYEPLRASILKELTIETMAHTGPRAFAEIGGEKVNTTVFVLRRQPDAKRRDQNSGLYFRLVHEDNSERKRARFEQTVATLQRGATDSIVYRVKQSKFDAIPGSPWVYWLLQNILTLVEINKNLRAFAIGKHGLSTCDNFRFTRLWWEVGHGQTTFGTKTVQDTERKGHWFPFMKGGQQQRWFGNQDFVVNWHENGSQIKADVSRKFPYLGDSLEFVLSSDKFYFQQGITWTKVSSAGISMRYQPPGFIAADAGMALYFTENSVARFLPIVNSSFAKYFLTSISPTINFTVSDVLSLPLPSKPLPSSLTDFAAECIFRVIVTQIMSDETTFDFKIPLSWRTGKQDRVRAQSRLIELERQIDDEVYSLYGINQADRLAIETELGNSKSQNVDNDSKLPDDIELPDATDSNTQTAINDNLTLAVRWISYAVGIVLGRFRPGTAGVLGSAIYRRKDFAIGSLPEPSGSDFDELVGTPKQFAYVDGHGGRHVFSVEVEKALHKLVVPDGIAVLDEGHPLDLTARVFKVLDLMLGTHAAQEVVREGAGDDLRGFLERDFFTRWHVPWYRKRPVYWYFQSPRRMYGFVVFHERMTGDTLFALQGEPYLQTKRNTVQNALDDLRAIGKNRTAAQKRNERELQDVQQDVDEFSKLLFAITQGNHKALESLTHNDYKAPREETHHGYKPAPNWIDDGVILCLAPLFPIMPLWKAEPKKYWEKLKNGDYDWSHLAMHYWPARVREKCKTNKSFAIAHEVEHLYRGK